MPRPLLTRRLFGLRPDSSLLVGLEAFWQLDEASGVRVDSGPHGLDLTAFNNPGQAAGKHGSAVALVAASQQYLARTAAQGTAPVHPAPGADFTISLWWYPTSTLNSQQFSLTEPGGLRVWRLVGINNNGSQSFIVDNGAGTLAQPITANQWVQNAWNHILAWYDATAQTANVQLNGGAVASAAFAATINQNPADLILGRNGLAGGIYADGRADLAGYWSRLFTATERANLGLGIATPFVGY